MKPEMSPKERVLTSLDWREPDRVPVQIHMTPEVRGRLQEHFGCDPLEALKIDFRQVGPRYTGPVREPHDGVHYDIWGTGYRRVEHGSGGAYEEAVELPLAGLQTLEDVQNYPWPNPDDFDYSVIPAQCARHRDFAIMLGGAGDPDILNGVSRGRGMERVMMDICLRDPVGMAIIDRRVEFCYEVLRRGLQAADGAVDILCMGEDCGNQNGRMFNPRDFDEVFRPRLERFYDLAHDFGARAMMHSCGDTHQMLPTFMEMGLDVLDAMQPEPAGMNPESMRARCRGRLAFCGLISTQRTLPRGTVEDCRREARHRLDVIAPGGGYIFAPAHCIQPDTPLENILAVYEEALGKSLM